MCWSCRGLDNIKMATMKKKIWNKTHSVKQPIWTAKFSGNCTCGYPIKPGQVVTRNKDGKVIHNSCDPSYVSAFQRAFQ